MREVINISDDILASELQFVSLPYNAGVDKKVFCIKKTFFIFIG